MYNIFQIKISKEVSDYVNSNDLGHTGGERKYPIYEAHMRLRHSFGDKIQFKNTDFQHYTKVCEVKKDAGLVCDGDSWMLRDLEDVFAVLNGRYFDEDTNELIDCNNDEIDSINIKKNITGKKIKSVEVLIKVASDNQNQK